MITRNKLLLVFLICIMGFSAHAQLFITEIMYNPPESGNDSLEYIEIYNAGPAVDVTGYRMEGVNFDFPSAMIGEEEYLLIAINPVAFENVFGISALQFGGALSNEGEDVSIRDANDEIVHEVVFDNSSPWPGGGDGAAGEGSSIVLCDFDNPSVAESWKASNEGTGISVDGLEIKGSPGSIDDAGCSSGPSGIVVTTSGLTFVPADITINVGETVTFTNGGGNHNANGSLDAFPSNPAGFYSGDPSSDSWEFPFTFTMPGIYEYQCDLHAGAGMTGTVTVEAIQQVVNINITEVMYNAGISPDSLEFIEIYNRGNSSVDLSGFLLQSSAINYTIEDLVIEANSYGILAKTKSAIENIFGTTANIAEWVDGTLSNQGDEITIVSPDETIVAQVAYDDDGDWPTDADGFGSSLIACNPSENLMIGNVQASLYPELTTSVGVYFVSPGSENFCSYDIGEVTINDADGINTQNGINAILRGIVYGINLRGGGLQFTVIDENDDGIAAFADSEDFGYVVNEGDEVVLRGNIGQFSGLSQIYLVDVTLIENIGIVPPTVVTELGEETESQFITLEDVSLVDPVQWTNDEFGFNVEVTNGTDVFSLRIDNEVTDIIGQNYPTGSFSLTGIGGQFDDSGAPFDTGYQILPRRITDIDPFIAFVNDYPDRTIGEVTTEDTDGIADSLGLFCALEGTVHGINLRETGLEFFLIDEQGDGISVFSPDNPTNYVVMHGDKLRLKGVIDQFNGLTQIKPDSLFEIGAGVLQSTILTDVVDESTESIYVEIESVEFVDESQWLGDGSSFTVQVMTDQIGMFDLYIDNDTELASQPLPSLPGNNFIINLKAIGSQRDVNSPFDSGYRLVPQFLDDIEFFLLNSVDVNLDADVKIFPNPSSDLITIAYDGEIVKYEILNSLGQIQLDGTSKSVDVSGLSSGSYLIKIHAHEGSAIKKLIVE